MQNHISLYIHYIIKGYLDAAGTNNFQTTHFDTQLLSNLSKQLSLNSQYINRIVKKEIGIPIYQYIHQCKTEKGVQLLYSGLSISETAYSLGFYDQSLFYKYFLKYVKI